ncbi:MAG: hydrolase 1, exosortase A system-associated [Chromatiales bacterium]|nr:hydrolase 1, exosortase A system-associated [Chromatiales bacterium]
MQTRVQTFSADGDCLAGVLHLPEAPATRGVLVVVGGPQYRVGSHRQFLLLARELAKAGFPVLRFDYRGMGDSDGEPRSFEQIDADIRAALDALQAAVPGLRDVAIWGLCDGAAAGLLYAPSDPRVTRLMLLNPWVRTEETLARSYVSEYYTRRLLDADFWRKLVSGQVQIGASLGGFLGTLARALGVGQGPPPSAAASGQLESGGDAAPLPERLRRALVAFGGQTLIILSGRDLTAGEFRDVARTPAWQALLGRPGVTQFTLDDADHTFSRRQWRDEVARRCIEWLRR